MNKNAKVVNMNLYDVMAMVAKRTDLSVEQAWALIYSAAAK